MFVEHLQVSARCWIPTGDTLGTEWSETVWKAEFEKSFIQAFIIWLDGLQLNG